MHLCVPCKVAHVAAKAHCQPNMCLLSCPRNRLGIRLEGPRPRFARPDGGEGGSHPSNVSAPSNMSEAKSFPTATPDCLLLCAWSAATGPRQLTSL